MYKLRKRPKQDINELGQDSFLDLVSNVVGILIILVMVAGIRAQSSPQRAATEPDVAAVEEMQRKEDNVYQLRKNISELKVKQQIVAAQVQDQVQQYAVLFDQLTSARAAIDTAAEEQGQDVKEQMEYRRQLAETNAKLATIDKTKSWLQQQVRPKATVVENIPTPLSKTVEEKEIHFRLLGKKVVYVPWIELMDKVRADISGNQERYFRQPVTTGKVGPVADFELEFMLGVFDVPAREGYGKVLSLQYAEMKPLDENVGELVDVALSSPSSVFGQRLALFRKEIYTVTVWVYPDSFEEYQELKQFLYAAGYRVAARPLAFGEIISGSPHGRKSSAQ